MVHLRYLEQQGGVQLLLCCAAVRVFRGQLFKVLLEPQVKGLLKEVLADPLFLGEAKVGHPLQVGLSTGHHDGLPLGQGHGGGVVAIHQVKVSEHPGLTIDCKVCLAGHELFERDSLPVPPFS